MARTTKPRTNEGHGATQQRTALNIVPSSFGRLGFKSVLLGSVCFMASFIASTAAYADADTTPPSLTSLLFPTTIDLSSGSKAMVWNLGVSDLGSGWASGTIWLDKSITYGFGANGTPGGSWKLIDANAPSTAINLSQFNAPGLYSISEIDLTDVAGNKSTYHTADLTALGYSTSFTLVGSKVDSAPPNLTSLSFPTTIDLSSGSKTMVWNLGVSDLGSGWASGTIWLDKSITYGFGANGTPGGSWKLIDANASSTAINLSQFNAPGLYSISEIDLTDVAGNHHTYYANDLAALGYSTSFTIKGSTTDSTPPTLTSLSFPKTIDVSSGSKTMVWNLGVSDLGSGWASGTIWLDKSITYGFGANGTPGGSWKLIDANASSTAINLSEYNKAGLYSISEIDLTDVAGNQTRYFAADLERMGLPDSFWITDSSSLVVNADQSVSSLTSYDLIALSGHRLTVGASNVDEVYSNPVIGDGFLIKAGSGTLTLSGYNYFTGGVTVAGGTLVISSDANLGSGGTLAMEDGTTLRITASGTFTHAVTVTGDPTFYVATGNVDTWSGAITGTGEVVVAGGGKLILTGTNTYSGGTTISAGTLQIGDGSAAGSIVGDVTDNATLVFNRSGTLDFAGVISGSGSVVQAGPGTVTLTAANSYTGGTTITAGYLVLGTNARLASASNVSISGGGELDINSGASSLDRQSIRNSGYLILRGSTTAGSSTILNEYDGVASSQLEFYGTSNADHATITNDALYSITRFRETSTAGSANIVNKDVGMTYFVDSATAGNALITNVNGGETAFFATSNAGTATVVAGGATRSDVYFLGASSAANSTILNNANGTIFFGELSKGGTSTINTGGGVVSFYGKSSAADATITVGTGGRLQFTENSSGGNARVVNTAGGAVDISGINGAAFAFGSIEGAGSYHIGSKSMTIGGNDLSTTVTGSIFDDGAGSPGGSLTKIGTGTLVLAGTNSYTGGTTIQSGTLQIGTGGTSGSIVGDVIDNGSLVFNRSDTVTFAGSVSGFGSLTQAGAGTLILTGTNTYTGGTTVAAGSTLQFGSGGATGSIVGDVVDNGVLAFNLSGTTTFAGNISGTGGVSLIGSGTVTFTGNNTFTGGIGVGGGTTLVIDDASTSPATATITDNGALVFKRANATLVYDGVIVGSGSVSQAGSGTLVLTATNTYTGSTMVGGGATLALSGSGSIAGSSGVLDNGTFDIASTTGASIRSLAGSGVVALGAQTVTLTGANGVFSGSISGQGGVILTGGTETFSSANAYTGTTVIGSGATLALQGAGTIATSSGVADGGTLDISGTTSGAAVTSLTGTGNVALGAKTLLLTNASGTFAGSIGGTGGVTVAAGTWVLTGNSTFTGLTTVSSGTLKIGTGGTTGSISGNVTNNASLIFNRSDSLVYGGIISGSGSLTQNGPGTLILAGANTFTGTTTVTNGSLQLGAGGTTGSIASAALINSGSVLFNRSDVATFAGTISGTGTLVQAGTGTLVLNGANTYTGMTTVSAGTLQIGDAGHANAKIAGAVAVSSGATLSGHGAILGNVNNSGVVAPGGSVGTLTVANYAQASTGTLTISISPDATSLLRVTGKASLAGKLNMAFASGTYTAAVRPIITAGTISGTFSSVATDDAPSGAIYGITYPQSGTEIDLVISPRTAGQIYADIATNSIDNARTLNDIAFDHSAFDRCQAVKGASCRGVAIWAQGIGGLSHMRGNSGGKDYTTDTWGVVGGVDYRFSKIGSLHATGGYTRGNLRIRDSNAKADTETLFVALAGHAYGPVILLDTDMFYSAGTNTIHRENGIGALATSSVNTTTAGFSFQVSYPLLHGDVTPLARASYAYLSFGPMAESGGGDLNLASKHGTFTTGWYDIGFRASHVFTSSTGMTLRPSLLAALELSSGVSSPTVQLKLADIAGTDFLAPSTSADRMSGLLRAGLSASFGGSWSVRAGIDGRLSRNRQEMMFNMGGVFRF